jgi:hypothetical protein
MIRTMMCALIGGAVLSLSAGTAAGQSNKPSGGAPPNIPTAPVVNESLSGPNHPMANKYNPVSPQFTTPGQKPGNKAGPVQWSVQPFDWNASGAAQKGKGLTAGKATEAGNPRLKPGVVISVDPNN